MGGMMILFLAIGFTFWVMIASYFAGLDNGFAGLRRHLLLFTAIMLVLGIINGWLGTTQPPFAPFFDAFLIFGFGWVLALGLFALCYGVGYLFRRKREG